jgi:hypothetical protein
MPVFELLSWSRRLPCGLGRWFDAVAHPASIMHAAKEKARVMAGRSLLRNKSRAQVDGLRISVQVLQQTLVELICRHRVQDLRLDLFGALAEVVLQIAFLLSSSVSIRAMRSASCAMIWHFIILSWAL